MTRHEEGFTLIELLVAMVVGMIILLGAFTALDRYSVVSATVGTRTDSAQRGRLAMDQIIRSLRSQVCKAAGDLSLVAGTQTSVTVITDLSDGSRLPDQRTFAYDATSRRLRETRAAGKLVSDNLTFPSAANGLNLADVDPDGTNPVFGYYAFDPALDPPEPSVPLPVPLSDTDRARVALIKVSFRVGPQYGRADRGAGAALNDQVLLRNVDPSDALPLPLCV